MVKRYYRFLCGAVHNEQNKERLVQKKKTEKNSSRCHRIKIILANGLTKLKLFDGVLIVVV